MDTFLIDTFLELVKKVTEVAKLKEQNRQRIFREIVEPLFNELQPIVDDYLVLFGRAKELVMNSSQSNLPCAVAEIRTARQTMLRQRREVVEMAKVIRGAYDDKQIITFAERICDFFFGVGSDKDEMTTPFSTLDALCGYVMRDELSKQDLVHGINLTLEDLESSWVAIAQSYAILRVHCLSPWGTTKIPKRKK